MRLSPPFPPGETCLYLQTHEFFFEPLRRPVVLVHLPAVRVHEIIILVYVKKIKIWGFFKKGNQLKSNSQNTNTNPHPNFRGTFTLFWSQDLIIPLAVLKHNLPALDSPVLKLWTFATTFKESEPSLTCNPFSYPHRLN